MDIIPGTVYTVDLLFEQGGDNRSASLFTNMGDPDYVANSGFPGFPRDDLYEYGDPTFSGDHYSSGEEQAIYDEATTSRHPSFEAEPQDGYILTGERYLEPRPLINENRELSVPRSIQRVPSRSGRSQENVRAEQTPPEPAVRASWGAPALPRANPQKVVIKETASSPWIRLVLVLYAILFVVAFSVFLPSGIERRDLGNSSATQVIVQSEGVVGSNFGSLGQVGFFATLHLPPGWIICDGRRVEENRYPNLAALLGPNASVPDLISDGRYIRGGLEPGVVQEQSTAVNGLGGAALVWDNIVPGTVFNYNVRRGTEGQRHVNAQYSLWRSSSSFQAGIWSQDAELKLNSTDAETRPPTIILVPAIYGF